jgi:TATA-box binding protein (TBP) (component of TFIID and TFIIIB)
MRHFRRNVTITKLEVFVQAFRPENFKGVVRLKALCGVILRYSQPSVLVEIFISGLKHVPVGCSMASLNLELLSGRS